MTRETKLGIGVAGTFLAVVGTWAAVKLHRGDAESPRDPPAAAQTDQTAAPEAPRDAIAAARASPTNPTIEAPKPLMESVTATPAPDAAPIIVKTDSVPIVESPNPLTANVPTSTPTTADPPPPSIPAPVMMPPGSTSVNGGGSPGTIEPTAPVTAPSASTTAKSGGTSGTTEPSAPVTSIPAIGDNSASTPPAVESKKDAENPAPPTTIITKPAEPAPATFPQPSVTVIPTGVAGVASLGPPGGGPGPAATGVSAVRPKSEPRVQSYLEEEYRWQPGDRFEAVSQKYYFSEKYGSALQQYNRDHPLAGLGMRQNPPAMVPGQAIWAPPVRILERDYPNLIADLRLLNERGMPVSAVRPADSLDSAPGATKLTKVRDRGETMYEIARRTLNDSGQWIVVHRLNPTLSRDPKLPIPAGTVLRVPAEAKIEANDVP